MPGLVTIPSGKAVNIVGRDQAARITNTDGSATIYFGGDSVTSSSNDYTLTNGASRTVNGPRWARSSTDLLALVEELPVASSAAPGLALTRHWMHGYKDTSTGTNTTITANRAYVGQVNINNRCTLTGAAYLIGTTGGTHKAIVVLYDAQGHVLANSDKTGTTVGTGDTYQSLDFTTPVEILTPGKYFGSVIYSGTTPTLRTAIVDDLVGGTVSSAADFAAVPVDITVPTTSAAVNTTPQGWHTY